METFDLIVIGGGPAGYLGAQRAAAGGLNTLLLEKRALGGVCLNEGCVPSKALLCSAKMYDHAIHGQRYGVTTEGAAIDHVTVLRRKAKVVRKLVMGVAAQLKQHGVTVVEEAATVTGKSGDAFTVQSESGTYAAKKLLIAAGSAAIVPPIPGVKEGLESGLVLTSREILDLKEPPEKLVVVGGGVIGLEMAAYYSAIGCQVAVVEMLPKIAGPTEREASENLLGNLQKQGITFHLGCTVTAVGPAGVTFTGPQGEETLPADKILLSIGRRPDAAALGLESIGVAVERGAVATDGYMQTGVPGVYAAGDVNGTSMLAHTAYREAEVAVAHMLGGDDTMRYDAIPSVIYTTPEVACVGLTEEAAAEKGVKVKVARLPMSYSGRYVAEVEAGDGFCKLLVDEAAGTLVGAHLVGAYASEVIYGAAMMIETAMPVETIKRQVFPHPTVSEIIRETLFEL